eukprot:m.96988 g.96988  ORF g.96988 m.96988 type:complete len:93 (+) comp12382_c0_seq2:155-433(+)
MPVYKGASVVAPLHKGTQVECGIACPLECEDNPNRQPQSKRPFFHSFVGGHSAARGRITRCSSRGGTRCNETRAISHSVWCGLPTLHSVHNT